jgi:hypothetical protein
MTAHVSAPVSRIGGVAAAVMGVVAMLADRKMERFQTIRPSCSSHLPSVIYEKYFEEGKIQILIFHSYLKPSRVAWHAILRLSSAAS